MKLLTRLLTFGATIALATSASAVVHVTADITTDTKWTAANSPYILEGVIYVKGDSILDIEPGTVIRGQPRVTGDVADAGSLIITRGSKIQARGTAAAPIIFTTAARSDGTRWADSDGKTFLDANPATAPLAPLDGSSQKVMRLWGGVALCGKAQTNNYQDVNGDITADEGLGLVEGLTGTDATYGGMDDADNSGVMTYVSIRHGGDGVVADKEINALTLYSVGSGTTINNIDIYCTSDDGIEIFGGTVSLSNLNINYADDDGFDVDEGWRGSAQFVFILQGFGYGDKGLELDGDDWDENQAVAPLFPISNGRIYNATIISRNGKQAVDMKNGFAGALVNSILWKDNATAADSAFTTIGATTSPDVEPGPFEHFEAGTLRVSNTTVWNFSTAFFTLDTAGVDMASTGVVSGTFAGETVGGVFYPTTLNRNGSIAPHNPQFSVTHGTSIDAVPAGTATAVGGTQAAAYVISPARYASYRGAFDPAAATQWTFGWTALNIAGVLVD